MPTSPFDPIPRTLDEWLDYCSEWIAEGVYDVPAIETREEFKDSIKQALKFCVENR